MVAFARMVGAALRAAAGSECPQEIEEKPAWSVAIVDAAAFRPAFSCVAGIDVEQRQPTYRRTGRATNCAVIRPRSMWGNGR
jgi:hypothetical protein